MQYPHLFSKGRIGKLELRNRVVMPAMGSGLAAVNGEATPEIIRYYEERAAGGVGLIITEITRIDDQSGIGLRKQLGATEPEHIISLEKIAEAVHRHGAKLFVQLQHPGAEGNPLYNNPKELVAPSAVACRTVGITPRELTVEEIGELIKAFIKGARIAQMAGADGVEIHAAHGYLVNQFLSPLTNRRDDNYGGSFEKRQSFITAIIKGIQMICGPAFPISVRLSVDEFSEGGIDLAEGVSIAQYLETLGIAALNISSGTYDSAKPVIEPMSYDQGWRLYLAKAVKQAVKIPVIGVGVIREPAVAEQALEQGDCDFVALGRPHLADPAWANKAKAGREKDIRPCISCMYCWEELNAGRVLKCAVNPRMGRELTFSRIEDDSAGRCVAVIGGGPAGMEAARVLALRGFKPVLFEREAVLGGQIRMASILPHKDKVLWLLDHLEYQLNELGVEIRRSASPTIAELKALDPCAVMLASGAEPGLPPIKCIGSPQVCTVDKVLRGEVRLSGKRVAVLGSGLTGLETALYLAEQGNQVTVIEIQKQVGPGVLAILLADVMPRLKAQGVTFLTETKLTEVRADKLCLEGSASELEVDVLVVAAGVRSRRELQAELEANFENVVLIGDADKPGKIGNAIYAGSDQASLLS